MYIWNQPQAIAYTYTHLRVHSSEVGFELTLPIGIRSISTKCWFDFIFAKTMNAIAKERLLGQILPSTNVYKKL